MIIVEFILTVYTSLILGTTSIIEIITGLYPREQLAYVQEVQGLPETAGFSDVISGGDPMTTTQGRSTEVIRNVLAQAWNAGSIFDTRKFPEAAAQALTDEWLIMPDLPEPERVHVIPTTPIESAEFGACVAAARPTDGQTSSWITVTVDDAMTVSDASAIALNILAAAHWVEQGRDNE